MEVCYTEARPDEEEGPFLGEERLLIDSIAEMLRGWFQHRLADEALERIRLDLERRVEERTAELGEMANALFLAGERERRSIAEALHDHIGQSLAFARMRLLDIQGNAVFCGFEGDIAQVLRLVDGALRHTRDLTSELSPPRLYELGLDAAVEGLVERFGIQHKLDVTFLGNDQARDVDLEHRLIVYAAARELLTNAVKHAKAKHLQVKLKVENGFVLLEVRDDGVGFDPGGHPSGGYGLCSLRERLRAAGGRLTLHSSHGAGTRGVVEIPQHIGVVA